MDFLGKNSVKLLITYSCLRNAQQQAVEHYNRYGGSDYLTWFLAGIPLKARSIT
jgi:hypothetical protein